MYRSVNKREQRKRRHVRVRAKVQGNPERPRLAVFRSNRYIYAQLIDDLGGKTLVSLCDMGLKLDKAILKDAALQLQTPKIERAYQVGMMLAELAIQKKITQITFDRAGFKYHGRIKALADGARAGGLIF